MKTILVTGGTRGIGRATALKCARKGWSVALTYLSNQSAAEEAAREVRAAGGTQSRCEAMSPWSPMSFRCSAQLNRGSAASMAW